MGKISVQTHTWREPRRVLRYKAHEDAAKSRGETGRRRDRGHGHPSIPEDHGIDDDDVSHCQKGRQVGDDFRPRRRAAGLESKIVDQLPIFRWNSADQALRNPAATRSYNPPMPPLTSWTIPLTKKPGVARKWLRRPPAWCSRIR